MPGERDICCYNLNLRSEHTQLTLGIRMVSEAGVSALAGGDGGGGGDGAPLSRSDCVCPVCLDIFLEPVTLPCAHTFCKPCFLETVDKANMCCPLCRKRVSTWARLHARKRTLVNGELWRRVQEAFPSQCERRLKGLEEDECEAPALAVTPRICEPGELRREYEDQMSKLAEEKRALEEAEKRASEVYIQRLLEEEEELRLQTRREEEQQLERDEMLARRLNHELNSRPVPSSPVTPGPPVKKLKTPAGNILKFLHPVPHKQPGGEESSAESSLTANKENIRSSSSCSSPAPEGPAPSGKTSTSKRRRSEPSVPAVEEACLRRWQQEEQDRCLAERLRRELNREPGVDRRKGSADGYQLRHRAGPAQEEEEPCNGHASP